PCRSPSPPTASPDPWCTRFPYTTLFRSAEALVKSLAAVPLERVISSPYVRCVQTVEPLARARGLPVEETETIAEGAGLPAFLELLSELAGRQAALCTHGDIMYDVCEELVRLGLI